MLKAFCHCLHQYFPILLSMKCVLSMFILGVISNINCLSSFSRCYYSLQMIVNLIIYKLGYFFVYLNSFPNLEMQIFCILHETLPGIFFKQKPLQFLSSALFLLLELQCNMYLNKEHRQLHAILISSKGGIFYVVLLKNTHRVVTQFSVQVTYKLVTSFAQAYNYDITMLLKMFLCCIEFFIQSIIFFFVFQRAQPEIVTFLGYESDNALYTIPGDHPRLFLGIICLHFIFWHETVNCTKLLSFS